MQKFLKILLNEVISDSRITVNEPGSTKSSEVLLPFEVLFVIEIENAFNQF